MCVLNIIHQEKKDGEGKERKKTLGVRLLFVGCAAVNIRSTIVPVAQRR